jgi:hypothetical protein
VVRYPFHPLAGREVVVRVGEQFVGEFRVVHDSARRVFAFVPAWMFDARWTETRVEGVAHVSVDALVELADLLSSVRRRLDRAPKAIETGSHGPTDSLAAKTTARDAAARCASDTGAVDVDPGAGATRSDPSRRAASRATRTRRNARGAR